MVRITGIRFKQAGKIYQFDAGDFDLNVGDYAIVKTARGQELGHVVVAPQEEELPENREAPSPVVRVADGDDIARAAELDGKSKEAYRECEKMITDLGLPMKLLTAEYNFDGSRLTFLFSAEERVDFRDLVRRLTARFKTRVELRQVGSRDEAKLLGSYGRCGRNLCCSSFLTEFTPVSIKMAKEQDLPLNPMKISGACGRLMCCLAYEGPQYRELKAKMPKKGQRVSTRLGDATVIGNNMLKETVIVALDKEGTVEVPLAEISF